MFVYKLKYKNYYFIGTIKHFIMKNLVFCKDHKRYEILNKNKSNCCAYYRKNNKQYNRKVYKKFRELGITEYNFYKDMECEILCECNTDNIKEMKIKYIKLEDEFCLNTHRF